MNNANKITETNVLGLYICKYCNFSSTKKSNYESHKRTKKHAKNVEKRANMSSNSRAKYTCDYCFKCFKSKSGLWKHHKTCNIDEPIEIEECSDVEDPDGISNNILLDVVRQNNALIEQTAELQKKLQDQQELFNESMKQLSNVTNITDNRKYTNNLNLNFFLNEQCRDAISIQNFVQSIRMGISEMQHMRDVGFVDGIISILGTTLRSIDLYKRPMHCTDIKRETLYFKQGDKWEKDTEERTELKKLIKAVEDKNCSTIEEWKKKNPSALECDTPANELYIKMMSQTLGSDDEEEQIRASKVAKHISREIYVGK